MNEMLEKQKGLLEWPGKSPVSVDGIEHPALYHMLDVAACCEVLLSRFEFDRPTKDALTLFVFLHDLGKISDPFRQLIEKGDTASYWYRHWELSEAYLFEVEESLARRLSCRPNAIGPIIAAISGHHGRPSDRSWDDQRRMVESAGTEARRDALKIIDLAFELWPEASFEGLRNRDAKAISWWIAGLTTAADWIGSNQDWFEPTAPDWNPQEYLARTRQKALHAVRNAGLEVIDISERPVFDFEPRVMQRAAQEIELPDGPTLAILEDETGSGKTEAAIMLAQRMLLAGKARGLFFALPTMATSDAMFERMRSVIGALFLQTPTLSLAHGRASLSASFRNLIAEPVELPGVEGALENHSDDVTCTPWLAEGGRKALLAHVGVGTIDQALKAVLPTRFSTLRMWALSNQLIIVDEVHEMGDPYMAEELAALLKAHAQRGGSAILLTATLPLPLRQRLLDAFNQGLSGASAAPQLSRLYPTLSLHDGVQIADPNPGMSPKGPVEVARLPSTEEALEKICAASRAGGCALWVRNAVDDAIEAVDMLRSRGVDALLFHARFTLGDRKRIEAEIRSVFGKESANERRDPAGNGRVLVATQVVESSLDLDFDFMVSDLAPVAALIQRAGRLWRHLDRRPAHRRPVPGPVLHVLSPEANNDVTEDWLDDIMPKGRYVYALDDQWRTAKALFDRGEIVAPGGLRDLVESVHGDNACDPPEGLRAAEDKKLAAGYRDRGLAGVRIMDLAKGYRDEGRGKDEETYPTRLGQATITLHLVRREQHGLMALFPGRPDAFSEVQVALRKIEDRLPRPLEEDDEIRRYTQEWPKWKREGTRVCILDDQGGLAEAIFYDRQRGLFIP